MKIFFKINKKVYYCEKNNYLIIDYLNYKIGKRLLFNNINYFFNKKVFFNKNKLNFKVFIIVLKHFYLKTISLKKKRRKNFIKKIINYKKKSLIYIQNII